MRYMRHIGRAIISMAACTLDNGDTLADGYLHPTKQPVHKTKAVYYKLLHEVILTEHILQRCKVLPLMQRCEPNGSPTHHAFVLLHVLFEVSLVLVVDQQPTVVQGEVALVKHRVGFILLVHVPHDQRMPRRSDLEGFARASDECGFAHRWQPVQSVSGDRPCRETAVDKLQEKLQNKISRVD